MTVLAVFVSGIVLPAKACRTINVSIKHTLGFNINAANTACEPVGGSLEREETPPSLQAPESAMISWRQLATEQTRDPVRAHGDGE